MDNKYNLVLSSIACFFASVIVSTPTLAAGNFSIKPTPGTTLPSTVQAGSSVSAFYTITNNTSVMLSGYQLSGLPAHVNQNTVGAEHCGNPVSLAPHASCILELVITNAVQGDFALCKGASCTIACSPLSITVIPPLPPRIVPLIAAGSYANTSHVRTPLLVLSQDLGGSWSYPESITAPIFTPSSSYPYNRFGEFNGASCNGVTCIAVGDYFDGSSIRRPLLALSKNSGTTWSYPDSITAPVFTPTNTNPFLEQGTFWGASCAGSTCIAGGNYYDTSSVRRPLLAVSQDSGATWTYPDSIATPVFTPSNTYPFNSYGLFNAVDCTGNICIAVGNYTDGSSIERPLLAVSQNSATTWSYPDAITAPVFSPSNTYPFNGFGVFYRASCSGTTCIAAGSYSDGSVGRPLLAVSQNSGTTWSYPEPITAPVFTPSNTHPYYGGGQFFGASCNGSTCIAAGDYVDSGFVQRPLLAVSHDSGVTWSYPDSITTPVFAPSNTNPFLRMGIFNGANCSGSLCLAAGSYIDTSGTRRPLLAVSQDSGVTWSYPDSIAQTVFTPLDSNPFNSFGELGGISCIGSTCVVVGDYVDSSFIQRPLLAITQDSGTTWSYPDVITAPVFTPSNSVPFGGGGIFNATAAGTLAFLPDRLKFIEQPSV